MSGEVVQTFQSLAFDLISLLIQCLKIFIIKLRLKIIIDIVPRSSALIVKSSLKLPLKFIITSFRPKIMFEIVSKDFGYWPWV